MSQKYPTNLIEFIESDWFSKVKTIIRMYHLREDPEDTMQSLQEVLLTKNYLARWAPQKGAFSTWLYKFVNNFLKKRWNHEHCQGANNIEMAIRLDKELDDATVGDFVPSQSRSASVSITVADIEHVLSQKKFKAFSTYKHKDRIYQRDMLTVFQLWMQGNKVNEIALILGTSPQFVYSLLTKIKKECKDVI